MEKNGGRVVTMSDVYHLLLNNIKNKKIDRQLGLELLKQISNNEQKKKEKHQDRHLDMSHKTLLFMPSCSRYP